MRQLVDRGHRLWRGFERRPRAVTVVRAPLLLLLVTVALVRVARPWSVFAATSDEPQHIAAGLEWLGGAAGAKHEPWCTVNMPVARVAVGLGPHLRGLRP